MFGRVRSFWFGLTLPLDAAKLILKNKSLMFWSALPIAVTLAIYGFIIARLQNWAHEFLNSYFLTWGWDPEGWGAWVVTLVTKLIMILVAALTFTFTAGIVASPFNDTLAEKAESKASPPLPAASGKGVKHQATLIWIDLIKTVAVTAAGVIAILFSWIPFLNFVSFGFFFLLVCFQYTSYPQTRRSQSLRDGLQFLWDHLWACSGFGATITFLYAIPLVSSVALPLAVVSGTLLVARAQPNRQFQLK